MTNVMKIQDLGKKIKQKQILQGISLEVEKQDIYGIIGQNGAGKTTLLKMLSGLTRPTSGTITIMDNPKPTFHNIGCLIEHPGIYPHLTARENLRLLCLAKEITHIDTAIEQVLTIVGLETHSPKKTKAFSLGMKQRLGIAMALIGDPDIIILDEPINGLDPQGIVDVRKILSFLNQEHQKTIIISSHVLSELEKIATKFIIIDEGKCLVKDDMQTVRENYLDKGRSLEDYYFEALGGEK